MNFHSIFGEDIETPLYKVCRLHTKIYLYFLPYLLPCQVYLECDDERAQNKKMLLENRVSRL